MHGHTLLNVIVVLGFLVWLGELVWLAREATRAEEDWLPTVSGAALFFVLAAPAAIYAPDLVDRLSDFWARVTDVSGGGSHEVTSPRLMVGGKPFPLTEQRVRIGRYPNNDLVLDHPTVSAYHAEVTLRPDGRHELVDRESRNGTRINGTPIRSAVLRDGDQITLGALSLHYLNRSTSSERGLDTESLAASRRRAG
ncbi:MAG TPA: FHA domain-containing protein [Thermomicrobiaceae bacterium]|nr:FHA domain-containing protein [Thermomicrobiaceae bacterium]